MKAILFIGNSHTYYNDMVQMFKEICQKNGINVRVTTLTHGGKSLLWHSEEPEARFNVLYGEYDYVVLQDAAHPFAGEKALLEGVLKIKEDIDKTSAKTVLYMTWAEKCMPQNQAVMSKAYKNVAAQTDSILAPVGNRFWEEMTSSPETDLFADDGQHASVAGSMLISQEIYNAIFG